MNTEPGGVGDGEPIGPAPGSESVLDDTAQIEAIDRSGVLRAMAGSAASMRVAARVAREAELGTLAADGRPGAMVIAGRGAVAHAADAVAAIAGTGSPVQVVAERGRSLPGWVGATDFVVVCGGDRGATTLAAASAARGARLACLTPVGASEAADPLDPALFDAVHRARGVLLPVIGAGPDSTTFWSVLTALTALAAAAGVLDVDDDAIEQVASRLEADAVSFGPTSESFVSPAKGLALELAGTLPVVWATSRLAAVAAARFASELASFAGVPAQHGLLDDVTGDQLRLLGGPFAAAAAPDDLFRDRVEDAPAARIRIVLLRDADEPASDLAPPAQHHRSSAAVSRLLAERSTPVSELAAVPGPPLSRLAALLGVLDGAAAYVGVLAGVDPGGPPPMLALSARP